MDWIQFTIALCSVLGTLAVAVVSLIKLGMWIGKIINKVSAQVTPNGGNTNTLGDRVVRLENSQFKQTEALNRIEKHLGIEQEG